jgi:hypothetical protein
METKKRDVETDIATNWPSNIYAQGYLIPLLLPVSFQLYSQGHVNGSRQSIYSLSLYRFAVYSTVQVQINEDHHQFDGPVHTIDQACSKRAVLASQDPIDLLSCRLAY